MKFWPPEILPRLYFYQLAAGDLEEIMAIERASFAQPWSRELMAAELALPHNINLGARWGGRQGFLAGYLLLWLVLDEAQIHTIASCPALRGQGVGACLLGAGMKLAQGKGAAWSSLEVRPSNGAARKLYAGFGFKEQGRRKKYYSSPQEDALLLNGDISAMPLLDITINF